MKDAGVFQTAEIGVVIPEDEAQTKMVAQFISAMDSVKSVCHFQYLNQDKAMASLEKGTLDAVLSLPEQFYEDVDSGKNTPATIYFPENAPLNTRVFGELVADGVSCFGRRRLVSMPPTIPRRFIRRKSQGIRLGM